MNNEDIEICEINVIHKDIIDKVKEQMPEENNLYDLAELFKVFGDSTRIRILCVLLNNEMCVCDMAYTLNMTQSAISHQLRILKQAELVRYRKEGKVVYYYLSDEHVKHIFDQGFNHIIEK